MNMDIEAEKEKREIKAVSEMRWLFYSMANYGIINLYEKQLYYCVDYFNIRWWFWGL